MNATFERRLSTMDPREGAPDPTSEDRTDRAGERQTVRYVLIGPKGATQFVYWRYTGEMVAFEREMQEKYGPSEGSQSDGDGGWLSAVNLGYHARAPMYYDEGDGQECEYVGRCWYDGSSLNAAPVVTLLMERGPEAVWRYLEHYYLRVFETPDEDKTIADVGFGGLLRALTGTTEADSAKVKK